MTDHEPYDPAGRTRHRRYASRPEVIRIDWPSAFKVALAVAVLSFIFQVVFGFVGLTLAAIFAVGQL